MGKKRGVDMGLERNVILLESIHYDSSQIISSIAQDSKLEKLSESKSGLQSLIMSASLEIEKRFVQSLESMPSQPEKKLYLFMKRFSFFRFKKDKYPSIKKSVGIEKFDESVSRLRKENSILAMRGKLRSEEENKTDEMDYRWHMKHDHNEFNLSRLEYLSHFKDQEQDAGFTGVKISYVILLLLIFLSADSDWFYVPSIIAIVLILSCVLDLLITPISIRVKRNIEYNREKAIVIDRIFEKPKSGLDKHLENIRHLSLGQFFQPGDFLYRFVGYVDGNEGDVLLLRKRMRGTSNMVNDYIDRFSKPTLVAINIEEFVDLYTGKSIQKDDHNWATRIIKPNENWNN